jgi:glycosyl transferase family 25
MEKLNVPAVYIVHVRADDGKRRKFITAEMQRHNIDFEFMLDGDMSDMNADNMACFFTPNLVQNGPTPRESCAYKHLLIYKKMIDERVPAALIFEDDAFLAPEFNAVFNATMREIQERPDIDPNRAFISYENSGLRFVSKKEKIHGQHLYKSNQTRCAGAYYIPLELAERIYNFTLQHPCNFGIDWQHKLMAEQNELDVYWCEPAVVEQGSHNGKLPTLLDDKKHGILRQISWGLQRFYKRYILHR